MKRIARVTHSAGLALLVGAFACGKVNLDRDAATGPDGPTGDAPGPIGDAPGPIGDAPGPTCDFASVGGACVFPPHLPTEQLRTCFTATTQPALRPPVGATVVFRKSGSTYQLDCTPNCGGSTTTIAAQEALFQMNAPLVEVFCMSSINIPAGVSVTADPSFDRAIAALASGAITIGGTIDISGRLPQDVPGGVGGPGGYAGGSRIAPFNGQGPCGGGGGATQGGTALTGGGGGGGGHVGTGGSGGAANPVAAGGTGGCTVPYGKLEGGSGGGTGGSGTVISVGGTNFEENFAGSGGGGALALISRTAVTVTGSITANGAPGRVTADNSSFKYDALGGTGGGAGGMIVLAALSVDASGPLHVEGGNGAVAWGSGGAGATGANPSGGNGANAAASNNGGAGGGGGGGYVRIMAASGTANCATIASPVGSCASSPLPSTPPGP